MKLFEAKSYDYSDYGKDKPVVYDEEFFNQLLSNVNEVEIVNGHDGNRIGVMTNLEFKDGWLNGEKPAYMITGEQGFSPKFNAYLLDKGDYYLARDGELEHIALVDNPRSQLFNEKKKGTDSMSEKNDINDVLSARVKELERELAIANNQLESQKKKMENYKELETEVKDLRKVKVDFESQIEESKSKALKWDEYESNKKASLVDEIAGDDSTMREQIKDWDIDKLNFLLEHKDISKEPRGVGNGEESVANQTEPPMSESQKEEEQIKQDLEFAKSLFTELNNKEE